MAAGSLADAVSLTYDAFISYSHPADMRVAAAVQTALERLAKSWYRRRVLRVFRDDTDLASSPGLWSAIEQAIDQSEALVLIASPEAAASKWVEQELTRWRASKPSHLLFIAVTDGSVHRDPQARDFDWARTTAIPRTLGGFFSEEPLYVDLRFARNEDTANPRNSRFRTAVARLGAPVTTAASSRSHASVRLCGATSMSLAPTVLIGCRTTTRLSATRTETG